MHIARLYVVGPRNTFVVHQRKVQGGNEIAAQRALRVKVYMKNDVNGQVFELNYILHIDYGTEMIIRKTARVYAVDPRNTFAINHRKVKGSNEIAAQGNHPRANTLRVECEGI
jgi:hypothetical protein